VVAAAGNRGRFTRGAAVTATGQPLTVVTNWGMHGAQLFAMLVLATAVAAFFYLRLLHGGRHLRLPAIVLTATLALAVAWCSPVLFSSDVYAYAAYGELAAMGLNPYAHAPPNAHEALLRDAVWQWGGPFPICVYGPAFVALARAVITAFAPLGTLAQLDALRAVASLALIACAPLAYAAFAGDRTAALRASATIALNPVAIWCAAEGHNDAIALAIVLTGFAVARRGFFGIGGAIVAFSALVKSPALLAAICFAITDRRARIGAIIGIALAVVLSIQLVAGVTSSLAPHSHYSPVASVQGIVNPLGGPLAAIILALAVAAILAFNGIVRLRKGNDEGWVWLALAGWVMIPNPYPWYGIWLVAAAALAARTRVATTAILLSFTSLVRYIPDAVGAPNASQTLVLSVAATLPLLMLLLPSHPSRRPA
jgi:hypothetical protein